MMNNLHWRMLGRGRSAAHCLASAAALVAMNGAASAQNASQPEEEIIVTGQRTADETGVGILGARGILETPLSVTGYTAAMIQDQGATTTSEVLANDPSVRVMGAGDGNYDNLTIRGFPVTASAFSLNGLYGVLPWNTMSTEAVDQFEVIRGPSTSLTGASPFGAIGGAINIRPKRATDDPVTGVTLSYDLAGQAGVHADLGRRFGAGDRFGARLNIAYRDGDTSTEDQSEQLALVVLGLDYRGDRLRLSADAGYQDMQTDGATFSLFVSPGFAIPDAPESDDNSFPPWAFAESRDAYVALHGEYDLSSDWMMFAGIGTRDHQSSILNPYTQLDDSAGNVSVFPYHEPYFADTKLSAQAGVRGAFETWGIRHQAVLSASTIRFDTGWFDTFFTDYLSNIYTPTDPPAPSLAGTPDSAPTQTENELYGVSIADTLSVFDDRLQLTLGVRQQTFNVTSVGSGTRYEEDALAPSVGVLYRVRPDLSVYANYMKGLSQGPIAPVGSVNLGDIFPPTETEQYEAGIKVELGGLFASLAVFEITQPSGLIDPGTSVFSVNGEQRNRGLELTASGQVTDAVRILGGTSYIESELTSTAGGLLDGNSAPGVPEFTANLGLEWDAPFLRGLTLTSRVLYTGDQYVDADNTQSIPDWTRLDAGARYAMVIEGRPVTFRLNLINVTGEDYWASAGGGGITLGTPRTALLSVTTTF